jgi:NAD+ kinase
MCYIDGQKNKYSVLIAILAAFSYNVFIVHRSEYTQSNIEWADIIIPTGGDGTYLMAASQVIGNEKPVVGLNSDPSRSEGYLCLPVKYSTNIREAIDKLLKVGISCASAGID